MYVLASAPDHLRYYEVVATVIPVLFIALAFQVRAWERIEGSNAPAHILVIALAAVLFPLAGEVLALMTLYQGHEVGGFGALVLTEAGMSILVSVMLSVVLHPTLTEVWGRIPPRGQQILQMVGLLVLLLGALAVVIVPPLV